MPIPALVAAELGASARCLFRADYVGFVGTPRIKADPERLGPVQFVDSGYPGSNPLHAYGRKGLRDDGLRLSVSRPLGAPATVAVGHWAAIDVGGIRNFPDNFMFAATFRAPRQSHGDQFVAGNYAAGALIIAAGAPVGATCQFRTDGVRLNLAGMGAGGGLQLIDPVLASELFRKDDPKTIGVAVSVKLSTTRGANSTAFLHIGKKLVDSARFTIQGLTASTRITDLRVGIGTVSGEDYRASLQVLGFQCWAIPQT
jgi:hypothetical protein